MFYELFITFVPKNHLEDMKLRLRILAFAVFAGFCTMQAQRPVRKGLGKNAILKELKVKGEKMTKDYMDSLQMSRMRIDSTEVKASDTRFSQLFTPLTFYHGPADRLLRINPQQQVGDSLEAAIDRSLMYMYLNRPDLVKESETHLKQVGAPLKEPKAQKNQTDIVEQVAPKAVEPEIDIVPDILVTKPNFWTYKGDYYLQFLQNYVSDNWYKGGESSYSMLGSVTMQANYNNKQKVKWDNKLEMRLGYQTTKGDSINKYKASDDLIRYTSKLGLQASKRWYYTLQMIAQTQFTHGLKNNDKKIYSDFFSPFNLNLSVGMDYSVDWLNHKLKGSAHLAPLAFNWKYVGREALATRYGLDEGKHGKTDYGSECTFDLTWQILENIKWKTRLYGYTTYERAELEWENTISFQFNRYISTNIFLYPRFDDGAQREEGDSYWQFKEYMSIGFSYSF